MAVGQLIVDFIANTAAYQADLGKAAAAAEASARRMQHAFDSAYASLSKLAATVGIGIGVGAFVEMIKGTIDAADHLENLSKSTGIAVETLGGLGFAASQTGGNLDDMASSFKKFNVNIAAAEAGSQKELEVFKALGISIKDLKTLSPDQLFIKAADAFASFDESSKKSALASAAFGKAYQGILPTLDQGGQRLQQNIDYFKRFGGISDETAKQSAAFEVELTKIHLLSGAFARNLTADLLPQMRVLAGSFLEAKEKGNQFTEAAQHVADVTTNIVVGVAYLIHWFDSLGTSIGVAAARLDRWAHLDFKGATFIADDEAERVAKAGKEFDALIAKVRGAQNEKADLTIGPPEPNRKRPAPGLGSQDAHDAAKQILDRDLAIQANFIKAEEETLKLREEFLKDYYQHDQISIADFYGTRQAIISEALAKEETAFAESERLLKKRIAAAKPTERAEDEKKLADIQALRAKTEQLAAANSIKAFIDQGRSVDAYRKSIEELALKVIDLRGDTVAGASAGFDLQNEQLRKRIDLEKESSNVEIQRLAIIGDKYLVELKQRTIYQTSLTEESRKYGLITGQLAIDQGRLDLLATTGVITELESIGKRSDLAAKYAVILSKQADEEERIAKLGPSGPIRDAALLHVEQLRLEIDRLAAETDVLSKKFRDIFESATTTFLDDLISRTKTAKQAWLDYAKSIEQSISQIASKNIAESIFGKTGSLGSIPDFFAKLFGKGLGSGPSAKTEAGQVAGDAFLPGALGVGGQASTAAALTLVDAPATALAASLTIVDTSVAALGTAATTTALSVTALDAPAVALTASLTSAAASASAFAAAASSGGAASIGSQVAGDAFLPGALGAGGTASITAAATSTAAALALVDAPAGALAVSLALVDAPATALAVSLAAAAAAADAFAVAAAASAGASAASSGANYASALAAAVASGGSFAVGTDYVPHDMFAKIHQGEKITPAAQNRPGGKSGNVYNFNPTINVLPGATRQSADQALAAYGMQVRRATAREQ